MKDQSRLSYQPRDSAVHEKRWTRGGVGSIEEGRIGGMCIELLGAGLGAAEGDSGVDVGFGGRA